MRRESPLLSAKLLPPASSPYHLARRRLLDRMTGALEGRATIVLGGPGYGKTALTSRFVQELGEDTVWYSLDATDGDPGIFFRYLVQGIREHAAEFAVRSEGTWSVQGATAADAERLADIFVNEAEEGLGGRLILVLDGIHHIEPSAACLRALRRILAWAPGTLHLILIGRSLPELGIPSLEADGSATVIREDELRFTRDETGALLRETFKLTMPDEAVARLHERTRGWVTALQLLRQTARLGHDDGTLPGDLFEKTESEIFDYFSEEVLASESQAARDFLLASSLPEIFDPDLCSEALGDADVHGLLMQLFKRRLFLSPLESRAEYYAYDPLFRDFLRRRLVAEKGPRAKRDLEAGYARAFARRGAFPEAIAHAIAAGGVHEVLDLLRRHGHAMLRAGTIMPVLDAARFVASNAAGGAVIDDLLGEAARLSGDYPAAIAHFERALEAKIEGSPELSGPARASTLQGLAYALMRKGEIKKAASCAERALSEASGADPGLLARIENTLAILRYRENRLDDAIAGWQAALDRARQSGDRHLVLMVAHNLGLPHAMIGDFQRASECFEILSGSENLHVGPQEGAAYMNLARIATIRGEFARAAGYLGDAAEIARKLRLPSLAAEALEAEGNLLRESGDLAGAGEKYARARRTFTELGQQDVVLNIDEEMAILAARRGSFAEAERLGSSVLEQSRASEDADAIASILLALGEIRIRASQPDQAVPVLVEAADSYRGFGRAYQEFLGRLWLALAHYRTGDSASARTAGIAALSLAARYDYRAPLMRIASLDDPFLDFLAGLPGAPSYLDTAESRVEAAKVEPPAPDSGAVADLTVRLFGPIEIFRDERTKVPAAAWKIRRSLELFCYLASSRNHRASKDRLVDALWGNARPATVDKNFHPTISFLRRALNHGHPVPKNFLLFEHGAYLLNPQYRYDIDADALESSVRLARGLVTRGDAQGAAHEYENALALYRGPFLEEEYAEWAEPIRARYAELRGRAIAELADLRYRAGEIDAAVSLYEELVTGDPLDEKVSQRLMRTLAVRGDRAGIEKEWQRLSRALRAELSAAPSKEARDAYENALSTARSRGKP